MNVFLNVYIVGELKKSGIFGYTTVKPNGKFLILKALLFQTRRYKIRI